MKNTTDTRKTNDILTSEYGASNDTSTIYGSGYPEELSASGGFDITTDHSGIGKYDDKGVHLTANGNTWVLTYRGILARSGACDIYAVINKGSNTNWKDVKFYPMGLTDNYNTFQLIFPKGSASEINIAFKDGADHWDNNAGRNYSYTQLPEIM